MVPCLLRLLPFQTVVMVNSELTFLSYLSLLLVHFRYHSLHFCYQVVLICSYYVSSCNTVVVRHHPRDSERFWVSFGGSVA
jgi:hypothetical protein